jgi:predicted TIM-barrel enzyme
MPQYTQFERDALHAKALQQIRYVTLAPTMEAASNRRFVAVGYLLALTEAGAMTPETADVLQAQLRATTSLQVDQLFASHLQDTLSPDPRGL